MKLHVKRAILGLVERRYVDLSGGKRVGAFAAEFTFSLLRMPVWLGAHIEVMK